MAEGEKIQKINIEEEMKSSYIDYSMSVIVARALPDVRDGLKPVHRRVLFGMHELGVSYNKSYKKSARIVGEVLGKYHPHVDSSVYMAMVRMAQPWSMRYRLVDGQGNFGSIDGDSPAALRYTEARLQRISELTLADIDKNTVDFQLNFDDTLKEPTVLPTKLPTLLVNGASGIAVGMATNIPPHNIVNVVDTCIAHVDNPDIDIEEMINIIKAPDFPTGGIIYGYSGVKEAYRTGKGRVVMRAKTEIESDEHGRERIIVTEIPYMVNKAEMIIKTADLINDKKIEGISNINDESDRNGMRIVYDIKRDAIANVVLNKLYKYTQLQSTFSVNSIALVKGRPKLLNLKEIIHEFIEHRHEVVTRRTQYELEQAEKRAHILEGLIIASDNIDEVVKLIRASSNRDEARNKLMERFELSEVQAKAIVDMRLGQLTGLEQDKLRDEYDELLEKIKRYNEILGDRTIRMGIVKDELIEVKEQYGDERRSEIVMDAEEFNPEDFYADEDVVITISHMGYIKRTALTEFKTQGRGGTGAKGSTTRDADFVEHMYVASMHNTMLFFTEKGKCFWLKVYEIPEGTRTSKGRAIQNMLNIEPDDSVKAYIKVPDLKDEEYINNHFIILATKKGVVKKTLLEAYSRPRTNGIVAVNIREEDELLEAKMTNGTHDILMGVKSGKAIRFPEKDVRTVGRNAAGVRGISLSKDDEVIGMITVEDESEDILVVSENGYGKRSLIQDYRTIRRGGKGVKTINVTDKTGKLIALKGVTDSDDIMIITRKGLTIRLSVSKMRLLGRATQGVKLINLKHDDQIAAIAYAESNGEEDVNDSTEENNSTEENDNNIEESAQE